MGLLDFFKNKNASTINEEEILALELEIDELEVRFEQEPDAIYVRTALLSALSKAASTYSQHPKWRNKVPNIIDRLNELRAQARSNFQ
ncbi:hypothetical protein [Vibrio owensii]|uniref:Chromosome partitioning protein ParA n=1 Tax=Vibrio owensii CAIM 1854 = LMG 25443 TaxID=1229493 RepID=A0A0C1ZB38_9VIBR|nr:hypothetical protein [Vibrio owensii]KIF54355.1 hypothetical protein H735_04745 [Vibrio owensii CAIM 1854 = LMG 25443]